MNHQKIYDSIIKKAKFKNRIKLHKNREDYIYYENHHINPKCLNGSEEKENKVLLTAKEHYVCHKLLTYMYPRNRKIVNAFFRMTFDKRGRGNISSRDYAYVRELKATIPISEETKEKRSKSLKGKNVGKKRSTETRKKYSKAKKGQIPWNKNKKLSLKTCEKMKQSHIGLKASNETIEKLRISNLGEKNPMFGKKQSEESNKKRSESMQGKNKRPCSEETKVKISNTLKKNAVIKNNL
jgi:hypothetical protein